MGLLLLAALLSIVLLPQWWLNQPWLRSQMVSLAAQQGVTLSYGDCRLASNGSGLQIDHLNAAMAGVQVTCDRVQVNGLQGVHIQQMKVVVDAALLQSSAADSGAPLSLPPILASLLLGRKLQVDRLEVITPYGNLTTKLQLSVLPQLRLGLDLDGRWSLPWQGRQLEGGLTTTAKIDPQQGSALVESLRATVAGGALQLDSVRALDLLTGAPHATITSLDLQLQPAQMPPLLQSLFPAFMQRVDLVLSDASVKIVQGKIVLQTGLQTLHIAASDGSSSHISGDLYASVDQQQIALTLPNLRIALHLPQPSRWGVPLRHALDWQGLLHSVITLSNHGRVSLQDLALTGDAIIQRHKWQTSLNAVQTVWQDHRLQLHDMAIVLQGDQPLSLSLAYPLPAGSYRLAVHRGLLAIDDGVQWKGDSAVDLAFALLPPLHADIVAAAQLRQQQVHVDQFTLNMPDLRLALALQGDIDIRGLDQLASRLHLTLSIDDFQPLRSWAALLLPKITTPKLDGTLNTKLDLMGKGHQQVQLSGVIDLDGVGFKQVPLTVQGVKLHLPFRQQVTLPQGVLSHHFVAQSALYHLRDRDLDGDLAIAAITVKGIALKKVRAHLAWDEGVLLARVDGGSLLGGRLGGYLQLQAPQKGESLPPLFARLTLQQLNSALLLKKKNEKPAKLNLFTTVTSDGSAVGMRFSVPKIKRATMGHLIDWLDPKQQDQRLQQVRSLMVDHHFAPSSLDARLRHRFLDVDVALQSGHGSGQVIPIHNLAVGHLLPW